MTQSKIYFLGPKTSYSEFGKEKFIKVFHLTNYEDITMRTITGVLSEISISNNSKDLAVLPIENSIEETVKETIDNISKIHNHKIKILAENVVNIEHCLISKAKDI